MIYHSNRAPEGVVFREGVEVEIKDTEIQIKRHK